MKWCTLESRLGIAEVPFFEMPHRTSRSWYTPATCRVRVLTPEQTPSRGGLRVVKMWHGNSSFHTNQILMYFVLCCTFVFYHSYSSLGHWSG